VKRLAGTWSVSLRTSVKSLWLINCNFGEYKIIQVQCILLFLRGFIENFQLVLELPELIPVEKRMSDKSFYLNF